MSIRKRLTQLELAAKPNTAGNEIPEPVKLAIDRAIRSIASLTGEDLDAIDFTSPPALKTFAERAQKAADIGRRVDEFDRFCGRKTEAERRGNGWQGKNEVVMWPGESPEESLRRVPTAGLIYPPSIEGNP